MSHPAVPEPPDGPGPDPAAPAGAELEESTGHPAVDAALRGVAQAAPAPPPDQIPAFQAAHRTLQETLASIDEG